MFTVLGLRDIIHRIYLPMVFLTLSARGADVKHQLAEKSVREKKWKYPVESQQNTVLKCKGMWKISGRRSEKRSDNDAQRMQWGRVRKKSRRYLEYTLKRSGKWVQGV